MKNTSYSIKDLEVLSGIKAHTIRIWEKRYNLLEPFRTETNIRYYDDNDLKRILNISLLVRNGYKISKVSVWDDERIKESVLKLNSSKVTGEDIIERLIMHMLNFENDEFSGLVNKTIEEFGLEEVVPRVFFELFIRIGTYWQVGSVFPAQEHFISNIIRQKIIAEIEKLKTDNKNGKSILFFLPENEWHELSLLYYSYLARKYDYQIYYLGQSLPFDDLEKISKQLQTDYVFVAFVNSVQKEDLENYLAGLKEIFSAQKIFITGGQIEVHNPDLPRNVKVVRNYHDFKKYLVNR